MNLGGREVKWLRKKQTLIISASNVRLCLRILQRTFHGVVGVFFAKQLPNEIKILSWNVFPLGLQDQIKCFVNVKKAFNVSNL